MSEHISNDIKNYITFLENSGYSISLTFMSSSPEALFLPLIQYDFHPHQVCNYLKQNERTQGRCVCNKREFMQKDIKKPYYVCCYAGVEEFLIPVRCDGTLIVCVHVSGFRGKQSRSRRFMEKTALLCDARFKELYNELSVVIPSWEQILSFVQPLCYMLVEFYRKAQEQASHSTPNKELYFKALNLIYNDEVYPLTCKSLAKVLNYSESYLRYVFKTEGHTTVQAKINQIRIEKAMRLLRDTDNSITQIAFRVGFTDSNYFSTYFKKQTGQSPLGYRKSCR